MFTTIRDNDYMDMNIGIAYRFLDNKTILTDLHDHNYYEYFIITSGEITHEVNGKMTLLKAGDVVFIRPKDCHRYFMKKDCSCTMINVSFCAKHYESAAAYLESSILDSLLSAEMPPTISLSPSQLSPLKKKHYFLNVAANERILYTLLKTLILDIISNFATEYELQPQSNSKKWLQTVLQQMNTPEHIEEGLPALIRLSGFSHGHLCRLMKKEMDQTPGQYITELRLQYAANLLATSDYDILSISVRLGFASLSHFITIFKKKYGLSPSKYRATHSNIHIWK